MARWMLLVIAAFVAVYTVTVLAAGERTFLIPLAIPGAILLAAGAFHRWLTRAQLARHDGDAQAARADHEDPFPSTAQLPDAERPAGDTPEAHAEINPHDIPLDNPARQEAEEQAGGEGGGTTRGNLEGAQGGPTEHGSRAEAGQRS